MLEAVASGVELVAFESRCRAFNRDAEIVRQVVRRMPSEIEEYPRASFGGAFDGRYSERRCIEQRAERSNPGLKVVARTEVGERRICEVTLHKLRGPALRFEEDLTQVLLRLRVAGNSNEIDAARRRTGARTEHDDEGFSSLKGADQGEQIRRQHREISKTRSAGNDGKESGPRSAARDIAEADSR